ncbi:class I SAM-dependent methyltransferase [Helicobacter mesocricetorum]|uniref:class I SAM-dependent methyltransferase n=1 Tax=Helicobacter mesocricetorum TaxID=87012 RepID=UPI000CF0CEEC|nr:class I SAM-dependent methyltransferase [Helicobacter mesocricetorum]
MDFVEISQIVEQRREELKKSESLVEVIDYGAGSPNENRSSEQMRQGITLELPLASLASIGVKREKAQQIFGIFETLKPKRILELGTCCGFSSAYMSFFAPKAKIYTIEGSPNTAKVAKETHKGFGLANIEVLVGRFDKVLPELLENISPIDFAFIDGHHDKVATLDYFRAILPFMAKDGVMLFDDIAWSLGMKEAWQEILAQKKHKKSQDFGFMGALWL